MKTLGAYIVGMLLAALASGCTYIETTGQGSLGSHLEYMKQAGAADRETWQQMKRDGQEAAREDRVRSRLRTGMLLTAPGAGIEQLRAGSETLVEILENEPRLNPDLRNLIHIRLQEANARRRLRGEVRDAESKINDLMSIERTMEENQKDSESRRR